MSERIIDAQGTPGGKAGTEVEAAAVKGKMGVVDLDNDCKYWSFDICSYKMRAAQGNLSCDGVESCVSYAGRPRKVEESTIAWSAHRELCQRVTELEAKVAELLEEKNEPPDPDWERERGSD